MRFICFAIGVVNVFGENVVSFDSDTNPTLLVIEEKVEDGAESPGCKLRLKFDLRGEGRGTEYKDAARTLVYIKPCLQIKEAAIKSIPKKVTATISESGETKTLKCHYEPDWLGASGALIGEVDYPKTSQQPGDSDDTLQGLCKTMIWIKDRILDEKAKHKIHKPAAASVEPTQGITYDLRKTADWLRLTFKGCTIALPFNTDLHWEKIDEDALKRAIIEMPEQEAIKTCLDSGSPKIEAVGGVSYRGFVDATAYRGLPGTLRCMKTTAGTPPKEERIGEYIFPSSYTPEIGTFDDRCRSLAYIAEILKSHSIEKIPAVKTRNRDETSSESSNPPVVPKAQEGISVQNNRGRLRFTLGECQIAIPTTSVLSSQTLDVDNLKLAIGKRSDIQTCLTTSSQRITRDGISYIAVLSNSDTTETTGTLACSEHKASPSPDKQIGEFIFPKPLRPEESSIVALCQSVAYFADAVEKLAMQQSPISKDDKSASVTPTAPQPGFSRSPTIVQESSTLSMIGTQEDIFFTNFHNAAQQLSLLGIKAVGLATQIQAIRGHMMMLKLIDEHIAQLEKDNDKYTKLLNEALGQLEIVTGMKEAAMATPPK
jgi:hypothetical protein